jgi:hypothetical protein
MLRQFMISRSSEWPKPHYRLLDVEKLHLTSKWSWRHETSPAAPHRCSACIRNYCIDFQWCNRSRDVGRTSIVPSDVKNVCLVFRIFQLSFTVLELIVPPVHGDYCLFRFSDRSHYVCHTSVALGDLNKERSAFRIFLLSLPIPDLLLLPVGGDHIWFP